MKSFRPNGPRKDGPRKDSPYKGGARNDASRKDGPRKEPYKKDAPKKDFAKKDAFSKDGPKRDDFKKAGPKRDSFRDGPKKDAFNKDGPKRDGFKKDSFRDRKSAPRSAPRAEFVRSDAPRPDTFKSDEPKRAFKPYDNGKSRLEGPVLYGFHAVRSAIMNPERRVLRLLATETTADELKDVLDAALAKEIKRPNVEIIEKDLFDRMMPVGAVHQGIAASVESLTVMDAQELVESLDANEKSVLLILDQVTDPHNVGAILRSAAAFGAKGVIMQDRHAPEMTGVLAKVASGAADVIPVAMETNLSRCIEMLQENGFFVIGLDERGTDIAKLPKYDRLALVLGAEGDGIRRLVAEHCDTLVSLPTSGQILSLNVSNAAAVALYATKA